MMPHAIVPAMHPATVRLVSLIQGLLDELHHVRSVLGHPVWSAIMRPSMTTAFRYRRKGPRLEPPDKLRDKPMNQRAPELDQKNPRPTAQPSPTPFGKTEPNRTSKGHAAEPEETRTINTKTFFPVGMAGR